MWCWLFHNETIAFLSTIIVHHNNDYYYTCTCTISLLYMYMYNVIIIHVHVQCHYYTCTCTMSLLYMYIYVIIIIQKYCYRSDKNTHVHCTMVNNHTCIIITLYIYMYMYVHVVWNKLVMWTVWCFSFSVNSFKMLFTCLLINKDQLLLR